MERDEVARVVSSLGYAPKDLHWLTTGPGSDPDLLAFPLHAGVDWFEQWQQLRDLVDITGRWPIGTMEPRERGRDSLRGMFVRSDLSAAQFLSEVKAIDPNRVFADHDPAPFLDDPMELFDYLRIDPEIVDRWRASAEETIDCDSPQQIESYLVRRQIEEGVVGHRLGQTGQWSSEFDSPTWMILIPDKDPINGLAYVSTFDSRPVNALAVARRWVNEHGVELVGASFCSYLFRMPEPITDPHQAWRMAAELLGLWGCSFGGGPAGVDARHIGPELATNTHFDGTAYP